MLNQFYSYLNKELFKYIEKSEAHPGDRFYLIMDSDDELRKLKNVIHHSEEAKVHNFYSKEFNYETLYCMINEKKVVFVFADDGITHDFLVTVRNKVSLQEDEWANSIAIFFIKDDLDSITGGAFNLSKRGAPFHNKSLRTNLANILKKESDKLGDEEVEILKFVVDKNFDDELVRYALIDFEAVYSIIEQGFISKDDYFRLGLFKDKQINTYKDKEIFKRLEENRQLFDVVQSIHERGTTKEEIKGKFEGNAIKSLEKEQWYETEFEVVKRSKDANDERKKVQIEFLEEEFRKQFKNIEIWDKSAGHTKTKKRERNIIVFKNKESINRLILPFSRIIDINTNNIVTRGIKLLDLSNNKKVDIKFSTRNKSDLVLDLSQLDSENEYYFEFTYRHNNSSSLSFKFKILLINFEEKLIGHIKTKYNLKYDNKDKKVEFSIAGVNSLLKLNECNEHKVVVNEVGENYSPQHYSIYDFSPLVKKDNDNIYMVLKINNVSYKFKLKEVLNKPVPLSSISLLRLIYNQQVSGSLDENLVKVGTEEFYLYNDFKETIKIEDKMIKENYMTIRFESDIMTGKQLELDNQILEAYTNFCELILSKNTLPSLLYYDQEVIECAEIYCKAVEEVLIGLKDNEKIIDKKVLNLHELGVVYKNENIYLSALHPLIVRYEIEKTKSFMQGVTNEKVFAKYNPSSLLPYYVDKQSNFYFSEVSDSNFRWLIYKPYESSNKMTSEKMRYIIKTRMSDFKVHFNYLFSVNPNFSFKVKFSGIKDKKVAIQGIIDYIFEELKGASNLYKVNSIDAYFDKSENIDKIFNFYNILSYNELNDLFDISVPSKVKRKFEEEDVIELLKRKINIFTTNSNILTHITFFNFNQPPKFSFNNLNEIESSVTNKGLLSSVSYTQLGDTYLSGFGIKGIPDDYLLINSAKLWNSFVSNNQNHHLNPYKVNEGIVNNISSIENQNLEEVFNNTNWVTFIDPSVDLSYFNNEDYNLYIIHYNDQTSSFNYESITVTNNTVQYSNILKEFLYKVNVNYEPKNIENIIRSFNILNGEWLLKVIGSKSSRGQVTNNSVKEKLSIISAYKQVLAILDNDYIKWIPISLEEIIRVSRQQGLESSSDIFSAKELNYQGSISDDLLFIGLEYDKSEVTVHFMPVEVKVGINNSNVVSKAKSQVSHLYNLLNEEIIIDSEEKLNQDFYRQFFLNLYFGNLKKFLENGVIDSEDYLKIFNDKSTIMNNQIKYSSAINENYGKGMIVLFTEENPYRKVLIDQKDKVIEVHYNQLDAYEDAEKSLSKVKKEVASGIKGIDLKLLLSQNVDEVKNSNSIYPIDEDEHKPLKEINDKLKEINVESSELNFEKEILVNEKDKNKDEYLLDIENENSDLKNIRIPLGSIVGSNQTLYWEYGNPKLPNRHLLISGKSGQGKTYFMQCLLYEMAKAKIDSLVIDYTDGFLLHQLESDFVETLGDDLVNKYIFKDKLPINPFKKKEIDLGGFKVPEENDDVADRVVQNIDFVFNLGIQQSSLLKEAIIEGLNIYGESFTFTKLKNRLIESEDNSSLKLVGRISKLLDKDPFLYDNNNFSWNQIFSNQGKVHIFQLKGYVADIQKIITEFILWDLYNYTESNGDKDTPIPVLLDEMQNLNHKESSPTTKVLKEGRKFGWSSWLATQSISSIKNSGDISSLFNAALQIHFAPPEDQVNFISKMITSDNNIRKQLENDLSKLGKGECLVNGYANINGELRKIVEKIKVSPFSKR
ncbi:helicase HerA domain-containing protein [Staphylococcus coagulans]|uniref:helicase HerA domain-containing protein n=1 Tax=Staphylococcus coagulans TaxID=74706 RepID=UPI001BE82665|nr:DUF87 domain-containing protein [Staphylococcus coagulans]MBT2815303.1 DUF87 domain-containing protein [Staphylococcus coagulans]MBT2817302.1 DUF87 domain-containing protein [Staphylococcus coagulans]MBT2837940.1 DUF87 domain-containing protein [Staphylococcus coagulans]MBT2842361.1 DUF87 domain-containing protein [Staphylococcus coagulans]MBT2849520.1 DUF87 domain-containing protein [Staphylococcus coagulans]